MLHPPRPQIPRRDSTHIRYVHFRPWHWGTYNRGVGVFASRLYPTAISACDPWTSVERIWWIRSLDFTLYKYPSSILGWSVCCTRGCIPSNSDYQAFFSTPNGLGPALSALNQLSARNAATLKNRESRLCKAKKENCYFCALSMVDSKFKYGRLFKKWIS